MLNRRRALMAVAGGSPSEWDSVWEHTDGLPTVAGWTRNTTGGTCSETANGLNLINNTFSKDIEISQGVVEAKFIVKDARATSNVKRGLLRIGNSNNAIYVVFDSYSGHNIRIYNNSNLHNSTAIGTFTLGSTYTVRIEINGSTGSVYINDVLAQDNINTASMQGKGTLYFGDNEQYGGGEYWQYVKYKKIA
jgi:hypothetical protein